MRDTGLGQHPRRGHAPSRSSIVRGVNFDRLGPVSVSSSFYRVCLGSFAFALVAGSSSYAQARTQRDPQPRASERGGEDEDADRSGRGRFANGIMTGRFRRRGIYSSLTLGLASCMEGRNNAKCGGPLEADTKPSFGLTKEVGFRIPWVLVGASYSLGFVRPSWRGVSSDLVDLKVGYQHSLLAVIRPTLPIWRVDLGFNFAPGWSRQVFKADKFSNRSYTQGFALGLGFVASVNITRGWIVGLRWDTIRNYHSKGCLLNENTDKICRDLDDKMPSALNMGMTGIFMSHRWF